MEDTFVPFRGIKNDLQGRLMCYKQDWIGGLRAGFRYTFLMLQKMVNYFIRRVYFDSMTYMKI